MEFSSVVYAMRRESARAAFAPDVRLMFSNHEFSPTAIEYYCPRDLAEVAEL